MALKTTAPFPRFRAFDASGNPLAGGKLYTYAAGTTTQQATYTDASGATANSNPVILDANGEADVWFSPLSYKLVLKDSGDVTQWTKDNFAGSPYPVTDEWLTYVHTWTYVDGTHVTVPGDQTAIYQVNKAIRATCTAGTYYGTITGSAYDGSTKTTLTVSFNSGAFDAGVAGASKISVGVLATDSPALSYATAAAASAADALVYAAALTSTSTSSLAIGTGSKSFTTQSGKQYAVGQFVTASSAANSSNYMFGQVTSYSGATLVVNVTTTGGSGTAADWNISIAGAAGVPGALSGNAAGTVNMNGYPFNESRGTDVASAAAINLDSATGNLVHVTGTTTITAVTLASGVERDVVFDGALTLTHGSSLLLPGAANITTAAGDRATFRGDGPGVVRCMHYTKANGQPLVSGNAAAMTLLATLTPTISTAVNALSAFSSAYDQYLIIGEGLASDATFDSLIMQLAASGALDAGSNYYQTTDFSNANASTTRTNHLIATNVAGKGCNFMIHVVNANDASKIKSIHSKSAFENPTANTFQATDHVTCYVAANAVSGFGLWWNGSNNFKAQGKIRVYGITN